MKIEWSPDLPLSSVEYDADAHALYVRLHHADVSRTVSTEGANFDCDASGRVIGVEVLLPAPYEIAKAEVSAPAIAPGHYRMVLDDEEVTVAFSLEYDASRRSLRVGRNDIRPMLGLSPQLAIGQRDNELTMVIRDLDLPQT